VKERPWTALVPDTVTERKTSKKWLRYFFDTQTAAHLRRFLPFKQAK